MFIIKTEKYRVEINPKGFISSIFALFGEKERQIFKANCEFNSSLGSFCGEVKEVEDGVIIKTNTPEFIAESIIKINGEVIERRQKFTAKKQFNGYFKTQFNLVDEDVLYTYPLRCYDKPIKTVGNIRNDYLWAVPLLSHIWRNEDYVCAYFIDRSKGVGTCDITQNSNISLGFHYPDKTEQTEIIMPFTDSNVPKEKVLLMRTMGANNLQILLRLVIPATFTDFISVLKINVGMSWVGVVMGEYLTSKAGLGYLIVYGGQVFKLDLVMSAIVVLCVLAGLMYALVSLLERYVNKKRN